MSETRPILQPMSRPIEVRRLPDQHQLRVTWSDGHVSDYPWAYLRGWCPCAVCQGHGGDRHYVDVPPCDLVNIAVVGTYALGLTWSDGHDSGIYSYRYLRAMCPCPACQAPR